MAPVNGNGRSAAHLDAPTAEQPVGATRAVRLLQVQIWLVFLFPASLRFAVFGAIGSPPILFGLVVCLVWAVGASSPDSSLGAPCKPVRITMALFWFVTLLSFAAMHLNSVRADESSNADRYLIFLLAFTGIALGFAEGLQTRQQQLTILRTIVTAIAAMSGIAVLQSRSGLDLTAYIERLPGLSTYQGRESVLSRSGLARPAGTATHPIEFGVVVGLGLALQLHLFVYDDAWKPLRRWLTLGLLAIGIPLAVSRSAVLVGLIVMVVFLVDVDRALRVRALLVMAGLAAIVFVTIPGLLGTLGNYIGAGQSDSSISTRVSDYAVVARYLRDAPWLGRGPATFLPRLRILDNQYLLTIIEMGALGLVVLVVVLSLPAWLGASSRANFADQANRQLARMFVAMGLAILASAATFDLISFPMVTLFLAIAIGLCGNHWTRSLDVSGRRGD